MTPPSIPNSQSPCALFSFSDQHDSFAGRRSPVLTSTIEEIIQVRCNRPFFKYDPSLPPSYGCCFLPSPSPSTAAGPLSPPLPRTNSCCTSPPRQPPATAASPSARRHQQHCCCCWLMDLDTENRLASLLMEEARRLRREADKEGVHVYLHPKERARPNSRFLTATVLGVQQANKAVEVDEMWRARKKEIELDNQLKHRSQDNARERYEKHHEETVKESSTFRNEKTNKKPTLLHSSCKCEFADRYSIDDNGLRDEDIEKFLHSRAKRGRGAVGSRMDEPGPYPSCGPSNQEGDILTGFEVRVEEPWERRALGPDKPPSLNKLNPTKDVCDTKMSKKKEASSSKKRKSDEKHQFKEKRRRKKKKERISRYRSRSP